MRRATSYGILQHLVLSFVVIACIIIGISSCNDCLWLTRCSSHSLVWLWDPTTKTLESALSPSPPFNIA